MATPGTIRRAAWKFALALGIVASLAVGHADRYLVTKTVVASERFHGAPFIVMQLENRWSDPISYFYERDKQTCYSWNVSLTVLRSFNLGKSTEGCVSKGTYTASGYLQAGYTLTIYSRETREYDTYYAERLRIYDDGSSTVVASTYATKRDLYHTYWTSTRS